ncbi:hypothetical protein Sros01_43020 [Streptomyces roseochromogenus]|nr:hypothetical protein Sros01_43020 [Streptomyces roseochromogenus]
MGREAVLRAHDPAGDLAWAGDVGSDRFGVAGAEGGEVFADDLSAPLVAAFADLQEETVAADLAEALGEAGVRVGLEGFQYSGGSAFVGGGQELVEVGVAEAPDGLAVEVQASGDGADGPVGGDEFVHVGVAVAGPLDDLRPQQFVKRKLHQRRRFGYAGGLLVGAFAQAGAVLVAGFLHRGGEVLQQMPAVGDFNHVGGGFLDRTGVGRGPVPSDDLRTGVLAQPGGERLGGAVAQDVHDAAGLDVDQEGSVGAALAEGELVNAQDPRGLLRRRRRVQEFQQPGASRDEVHPAAQPFAGLATELDRGLPKPCLQSEAGAAIPLTQPADLLDERPPPT